MGKILGSISLILIFTFHFLGGEMWFFAQRYHIRKEIKQVIKAGVPSSELQVFKYKKASEDYKNLYWHNPHEFALRGHMYDVVKTESTPDSIYLFCIDDIQEGMLFTHLDDWVKKKQKNFNGQGFLVKLLTPFFIYTHAVEIVAIFWDKPCHYHLYKFNLISWSKPPELPPPQSFL